MSHANPETCKELLQKRCTDQIKEACQRSDDGESGNIHLEIADVYAFDEDLANAYLNSPEQTERKLRHALESVSIEGIADDDLQELTLRLTDTKDHLDTLNVSDVEADHIGSCIPVNGQLTKVTEKKPLIIEGAFSCQRCGHIVRVPQQRHSLDEPYECPACDERGPWKLEFGPTTFVDQRKLKLETPPDVAAQGEGASATVYAIGDLCDEGGENGIPDRAGEECTVLAELNVNRNELNKPNPNPEVDTWLDAKSIIFHGNTDSSVNIEEHMDTIEECLALDDPVTAFRDDIVPALEADEDFESVLEAAVAWLFSGYRVSTDEGTYRGDIHFGLIGDPGTGKSTLLAELARIAPISEFRSGTGLTDVGLTAATVREEFAGEAKWTLKPGVLPRANGGHCIIDEVDDVLDGDTKAMHDALEGEQMVKIDKAGLSADLGTRTSLLASGNPEKGRFDPYEPIPEQVDLDAALIDRMDVLIALQDEVDKETDEAKAEHYIESYDEISRSQLYEDGELEVKPEMNTASREISVEAMRAWVAYCRENIHPVLSNDAKAALKEFYIDARNLNGGHDAESDAESIPVTPRTLGAGIRLSTAFARCEASETVEAHHVERAKAVTKKTIGLNWDPATGSFDAGRTDEGGPKRHGEVVDVLADLEDEEQFDEGVPADVATEALCDRFNMDESKANHEIDKLKQKGEVYEPSTDVFRTT